MMWGFGAGATLLLVSIFLLIKNQQYHRKINELHLFLRKRTRHLEHVSVNTELLTRHWEKVLITRLIAVQKHGLIAERDARILGELFQGASILLLSCLNEGKTLEEALNGLFSKSEYSVEDVKDIIKEYPNEIRLAWSKNNAQGLILALSRLSEAIDVSKTRQQEKDSSESNTSETESEAHSD